MIRLTPLQVRILGHLRDSPGMGPDAFAVLGVEPSLAERELKKLLGFGMVELKPARLVQSWYELTGHGLRMLEECLGAGI